MGEGMMEAVCSTRCDVFKFVFAAPKIPLFSLVFQLLAAFVLANFLSGDLVWRPRFRGRPSTYIWDLEGVRFDVYIGMFNTVAMYRWKRTGCLARYSFAYIWDKGTDDGIVDIVVRKTALRGR